MRIASISNIPDNFCCRAPPFISRD